MIDRPFRHELKYFINQGTAYELRQRLLLTMDRDAHVDEYGQYFIRSLYFDDMHDSAVVQKLAGVEARKKYRIRVYNLRDDVISLECKEKSGAFIHKRSQRISRQLCDELLQGLPDGLLALDSPLAREVYIQMRTQLLHPAVIVDYVREPFVAAVEDIRVTFDMELKTGVFGKDLFDPGLPTVDALDEPLSVLEVKFNRYLPDYYHKLLQTDGLQRSAASKYVLCRKFEART